MFPEYGITGFFLSSNIKVFCEYVPNAYNKNLNPCDQEEFQDRPILQRLSCLAKKYEIVVVANMASKVPCKFGPPGEPCPDRGYFQYNTDVAFSESGQLLAKYDKINVYAGEKEIFDSPPPFDLSNYGLFHTSFGFFGMFTCFDILFGSPASYLVHGIGVTDMVFPTAWMNELPLLSAIEFQEAWSMQFNVPLLASNQHLPLEQMTGSGIYNGCKGHVVYHYDMLTVKGKLLVGEIQQPKQHKPALQPEVVTEIVNLLKQLTPEQLKDVSPYVLYVLNYDTNKMPRSLPISKHVRSISQTFPPVPQQKVDATMTFQAVMNDDLYTFIPLDQSIGSTQVSSNNISCWLNYSRKAGGKDHFALGAFDGWHTTNGRYYIQACALVRCPFGDWSKCGQETSYSGTMFNFFSLQMYGMSQGAVFFPEVVTSGVNLAEVGTEWNNDCPACSWVYSYQPGVKRPLLTASLFARNWQFG